MIKKRGRSPDSDGCPAEERQVKPSISHHDHYKVLERVGEGTYGVVTKAYERSTGNLVALKKIRTAGSVDGLPATSLREIKLLKSLGHPHIIKLNSVFHESIPHSRFGGGSRFLGAQGGAGRSCSKAEAGALLLEFDYLECDLRKFMKHFPQRRIPLPVVKLIMYQLFDALNYIHSNQIIHRDIKPSNVLVNFEPSTRTGGSQIPASLTRRNGGGRRVTKEESFRTSILQSIDNYVSAHQLNSDSSSSIKVESRIESNLVNLMMSTISVKLADFGLARVYPCPARPLTHEVVTLWYRAPEVVLGYEYYNTSLDIWSMGCIMLELLYGRPVILGDSEAETMFKIFQLLGTPTNDEFVAGLPHFQKQWPLWNRRKDRYNFLRGAEEIDANCKSLLDSLLKYTPDKRCTAQEAMDHPWFDEIRKNH